MTQDDIIKLAREAGFVLSRDEHVFTEKLERFFALAVQAEREALSKIDWTELMLEGALVTWHSWVSRVGHHPCPQSCCRRHQNDLRANRLEHLMTTKQKAEALIKAWCKKKDIKLTGKLRHIYPRAYVIGRAAPSCLVYATPWMDAEPQIQALRTAQIAKSGLGTTHVFDELLDSGDWCAVAYVSTIGWSGPVAVSWGQA